MLNFKTDCYRGGQIRRHPKPRWHGCLNFKKPSCPRMNTPSHNVFAPSNAQHSKVMRNVQYLKVAAPGRGRWRKVCWKRFKLQQRTAEYQTRNRDGDYCYLDFSPSEPLLSMIHHPAFPPYPNTL